MSRRLEQSRGAGFTLLELVIGLAVMGSTLLAVGLAFQRASSSYEDGQVDRALQSQAHRVLDRVAAQFLDAGAGQFAPPLGPLGASDVTFRRAAGFDGVNVLWGDFQTIRLELEEGELDDAADNNGNGLVDERVAWAITNEGLPNEERRVITRWVRELAVGELPNGLDDNGNGLQDEQGLSFELQGDVLTIRLTLERLARGGRVVTYAVETSVRLRN